MFWDRFDALTKTMAATAHGKAMMEAGWHIAHTGGGCMAWEKNLPDGRYVWICDENNDLGERQDEPYLVGLYDANGQSETLDDCPDLGSALAWCARHTEASL
jgi:hypothetical protein